MRENCIGDKAILVSGKSKLTFSIVVALMNAGYAVTLYTDECENARDHVDEHLASMEKWSKKSIGDRNKIKIVREHAYQYPYYLSIAVTGEDLQEKRAAIRQLELFSTNTTVVAINSESIPLGLLQEEALNPSRLIVTNWTEPAHTTYFLEVVANERNSEAMVNELCLNARTYWRKDPYIIKGDMGIRAKMMSAMAREAFFLIEKGYATIEDIDRACRNDPGYYLSFAGNCRYMDLMGTYGYGVVMKDLNPELSVQASTPVFFNEVVTKGGGGMHDNKGLYEYQPGDSKKWEDAFRKFSYQIEKIIAKYPFGQ